MPISEAPDWVREFLEKKAPWWLEGEAGYLEVTVVDRHRRIANVLKDGHVYTLIPELNLIA